MQGSTDDTIYQFSGGAWNSVPGGALQVAVSPDKGTAWLVNREGAVFQWNGAQWINITNSPAITSLGVGPAGNVWGIGAHAPGVDGPIYKLGGGVFSPSWVYQNGWGVQIGVAPDNAAPWVANAEGQLWSWATSAGWQQFNAQHSISYVAPGPSGTFAAIGTTPWTWGSPDKSIYTFNNESDQTVTQPGGAIAASVDPTGRPWLVNTAGSLFEGSDTIAPNLCEFGPGTCTAVSDDLSSPGFLWITCSNFGNGKYSVSLSPDGVNWVFDSRPDLDNSSSQFPNPSDGTPQIKFNEVDQDSIYLSTCHSNQPGAPGCQIVSKYVSVCANSTNVCPGATRCATVPVTQAH
jgi:hypothetical protein